MFKKVITVFPTALSLVLSACGGTDLKTEDGSELQSASSSASVCPSSIKWVYPRVSNLNYKVLSYARNNLGKGVGNGECADLPNQALRALGAKTFYNLGPTGLDADYVWGNVRFNASVGSSILPLSKVVPGDVLQFRNARFRWRDGNSTYSSSASQHTAVVEAVSSDGQSLCVLEQNSQSRRFVTYGFYKMSGLQSGNVKFYRPTF
jgi:hypothetical protein